MKICRLGNIFQKTEMGTHFHVMKSKNNVRDINPTILMPTGNHRQRMKELGGMECVLCFGVPQNLHDGMLEV